MIARSGTYSVRSRIIDDDKAVYTDFEWQFKLAKVSGAISSTRGTTSGRAGVRRD